MSAAAVPPVPLPVDRLLPEILASLRKTPNLVLEAAPGAGKTTRVPPALLALVSGEILVLEPRRIAARLAANRVAAELGEKPGETVGYQVRFEEVSGPETRLRYLTEGVLNRRLLSDPDLRGVDVVILDEFHERHLDTDLALALLKQLQRRRPALRLLVMSATLDAAPVARFLDDCPVLRSEGRSFELTVRHLPYSSLRLEEQVGAALKDLWQAGHQGHALVFLPGAAEIRRAQRACKAMAQAFGADLLPLYGELSPQEQDKALAPSKRQKVILSTNLAESSVTIEGVTAVIDSGLARFSSHSPWSGLPTLSIGRISKASARQRAGRAGRTGAGLALRLYPQEDFQQRPEHDLPELLREDLGGFCLNLLAMGIADPKSLAWLDPPPEAAILKAQELLHWLGIHAGNAGTYTSLPLPPRLARMVREAETRGAGEEAIALAALLSSGKRVETTDVLDALESPLDSYAERLRQQLRRRLRPAARGAFREAALLQAVLAGFPDRVGRVRSGQQVQLSSGITAELQGTPSPYDLLVAVDVEDRTEAPLPVIRMTARVEADWLLDQFPEHLREEMTLEWNRQGERVDSISTLWYEHLVLDSSPAGLPDAEQVGAFLAARAGEAGFHRFVDAEAWEQLTERLRFAGLPALDLGSELRTLCTGLRSFADLREAARGLISAAEARFGAALNDLAPQRLRLPGGRLTPVHYEAGKAPWIGSRLQDFFGMRETPRIGRDRTSLVVHLLAPNQRAVQTTTDLAGFWERLYPQVRRELMRRYPRHAWPEDPLTAAPPVAKEGRRPA